MEKEKVNMLETIFEAREEDLAFINDEDKRFMNQDKANKVIFIKNIILQD